MKNNQCFSFSFFNKLSHRGSNNELCWWLIKFMLGKTPANTLYFVSNKFFAANLLLM